MIPVKYKDEELRGRIEQALEKIKQEEEAIPIGDFTLTMDEVLSWSTEKSAWDSGKRNYDEFDIVEASTYRDFNEANMASVYRHWKESKSNSFTLITAYQSTKADTQAEMERKRHENKINFDRLKSDLSGYGYFNVLGHSKETVDGKEEILTEPTLFVNNLPLKKSMELSKKYNQWGFIYAGPETKGSVKLYFSSGQVQDIGSFHPGKVTAAYSTVRGKPFVFESLIEKPSGFFASLAFNKIGVAGIPGIRKERKYISKYV